MRKLIPLILLMMFTMILASNCLSQSTTKESINIERMENPIKGDSILMPPPPSNDDCSNAINLTTNGPCVNGTTNAASVQGGEYLCINPGGGISPETVWYRFTATNTQMVLGVVLTNTTNCATVLAVYGPFAPGAGCLPTSGDQILCQNMNMGLIDPGFHPLLTGLVVGQTYLVQVQGNNCGGGNDRFANFCISINTTSNSTPSTSTVINNCGVAFSGSTSGGHYNSGTSIGSNNLDNNLVTTVAGASEVGDDVTFVINNASWFSFCNGNAGSCSWSININNINNCLLSGLNAGVQAAVFTGTPASLTNVASSPSRIAPGGSFNSGTFNVGPGACAYVVVDGFAGDECDYNLTLTNVSCPCVILPVGIVYFSGMNFEEYVQLDWELISNEGLNNLSLQRSQDGELWYNVTNTDINTKRFLDYNANMGWNYYKLLANDLDGNLLQFGTVEVYRTLQPKLIKTVNVLGNTVDSDYKGVKILIYDNGSVRKTITF